MIGTESKKKTVGSSWAAIALASMLVGVLTPAADASAGPGTIGTGTFTCGKFGKYDTTKNNEAQMNMVVQWAWGFMSAYNERAAFAPTFQEEDAPSPVAPPDAPSILGFIRAHCEKNPQSNVANAILELITVLGGIVTSSIAFPAS